MSAASLARAAEGLVGSPFRLHGREQATGLDCIGVLSQAMSAIGRPVRLPSGYRLRTNGDQRFDEWAERCGFVPAGAPAQAGDVQMARCAPCQMHLLIVLDQKRFVHAHAGLRRVVLDFGPPTWPIIGHWRLKDGN